VAPKDSWNNLPSSAFAETGMADLRREYVRFEIVDFNGKALSKTVPARHKNSSVFMYGGAIALGANAEVMMFPEEVAKAGFPNYQLVPDWETEQVLPWASTDSILVRRVYCEQLVGLGAGASINRALPRTACKRVLDELYSVKAEDGHPGVTGMRMLVGGELEFTLATQNSYGKWEPYFTGVDIFATLQNNKSMDFGYEVERMMEPVGVDIQTINAEYGAGQLEMTFQPKFGIEAADMTATFRTGVKEIANKRGLRASFMAKPFGVSGVGNGGHFNFSLWSDGTNLFHCSHDCLGLSATARAFLAGILEHAPAMEAFCAPSVPCYCRHGNWAPVVANWGIDDRTACVRVKADPNGKPGACFMELRLPSASANPYLVMAATVAAGLDGLRRNLPLPPQHQSIEDGAKVIPTSLDDSLDALKTDKYMVDKMGLDLVRWYTLVKLGELEYVDKILAESGPSPTNEQISAAWQKLYMEFI